MKAFEYVAPGSTADALKALAGHDSAAALAGGTDLINRMKDVVSAPGRVVYVRKIEELAGITTEGGGLVLGAGTRLADILASEPIKNHYQALRQATLEIGTPQIRNMATLGGNLLQRPRCWYYRNGFGLLGGRTDGKSLVQELEGAYTPLNYAAPKQDLHVMREGDNRYGAIFLTEGNALFVAPSSLAPALIALGAQAVIAGPGGERTIPVEKLYQVPREAGDKELTLAPGELLTRVIVPPAKGKNASYEVRWKQSHDWPLVLASVCVEMDGDKVTNARVVLGSVAPVPWRSEAAEAAITGKPLNQETAAAAGAAAAAPAKPLSMNAYKVQLVKVAVQRALLAAAGDRYWEA
jgi:xanthine dehydrogenase YagS FAD-binding subunit